jgi:hypothetical protein
VFDNERYGETAMQATHTAEGLDLAGVAAACGFPLTGMLREQREVDAALPVIRSAPGPVLYVAKVRAESLPFALPPKDGAHLKDRFRQALRGASATAS